LPFLFSSVHICPKCKVHLVENEDGLLVCPNCGQVFDTYEMNIDFKQEVTVLNDQVKFSRWVDELLNPKHVSVRSTMYSLFNICTGRDKHYKLITEKQASYCAVATLMAYILLFENRDPWEDKRVNEMIKLYGLRHGNLRNALERTLRKSCIVLKKKE